MSDQDKFNQLTQHTSGEWQRIQRLSLNEQYARQYRQRFGGNFEDDVMRRIDFLEKKINQLERLIFDTKLSQDKIDQILEVYELCKKIGK